MNLTRPCEGRVRFSALQTETKMVITLCSVGDLGCSLYRLVDNFKIYNFDEDFNGRKPHLGGLKDVAMKHNYSKLRQRVCKGHARGCELHTAMYGIQC